MSKRTTSRKSADQKVTDARVRPTLWEFAGGDEAFFNTVRNQETRLWYRVEWSPAIATE